MKNIFKILSLFIGFSVVLTSCDKVEDLPFYEDGAGSITLATTTPTVVLTLADTTNQSIKLSWSNPDYSTDSSNYKYIIEIDSAGRNFATKQTKTLFGKTETGFLTGREINNMIANWGFPIGAPQTLDVRVISSYRNNNERYFSNVVKLTVTAVADPAILTTENTTVTLSLANASQHANTFGWRAPFPGYTGNISYVLQYDSATKNFTSPQDLAVPDNALSISLNQGQLNATALNEGVAGGSLGKIEYRLKATTAGGNVTYSNVVAIEINSYLPILRFYLPGSYQSATGHGTNWTPADAPELIRDVRSAVFNDLYYIYIYLPANSEFKITQGRAWDINYGGSGGNLVLGSPNNLSVGAAGVYRISISRQNLNYDIKIGRMGFVGGGTGAGWNPPGVFPNFAMGFAQTNLFVGLTDLTPDQWKLIDNDAWDNGSMSVSETRSYSSQGPSGSTLLVNNPNNFLPVAAPGRYRVMWDGRDRDNVKYEMSPATEMRLVGNGIDVPGVNDWDPGTSPQMTYMGNGVWTITVALKADKQIKFVAGNAWGAFDYEDQSGGANTLGVPRPISWNSGGGDFRTPLAAGVYTITLNEHTQTVTIN